MVPGRGFASLTFHLIMTAYNLISGNEKPILASNIKTTLSTLHACLHTRDKNNLDLTSVHIYACNLVLTPPKRV